MSPIIATCPPCRIETHVTLSPLSNQKDMVTALSGSGPAYFMLVMEAITDAGVHMGLPRRMARQIVIETMYGASQLARETGDHPAYLRENITSPGGTTAAALFACEEGGLRTVLQKAAWAAYRSVKEKKYGERGEDAREKEM